ncbi:hypothetical protein [Sporosarcina sp. E16_8]|uniref:hypothetical protein n=1 Tax=Sporosarcina sp. E16_8 TaxID=2789295 RepID=UPI0031F8C2DE
MEEVNVKAAKKNQKQTNKQLTVQNSVEMASLCWNNFCSVPFYSSCYWFNLFIQTTD